MQHAVLAFCLALPAMAAQGTDSQESRPSPSRVEERTRPNAEQRWKKLDQDGDGRISRSEWQRNEQAFDRMDADKNGFLTKEELRAAAREFRGKRRDGLRKMDTDADGNISQSEWKCQEQMFNELDANHDGMLSRDELREARTQRRPGSSRTDQRGETTP
ncbi:MAG: EF-hand domain-containing protein [Terriglobia bacterium]